MMVTPTERPPEPQTVIIGDSEAPHRPVWADDYEAKMSPEEIIAKHNLPWAVKTLYCRASDLNLKRPRINKGKKCANGCDRDAHCCGVCRPCHEGRKTGPVCVWISTTDDPLYFYGEVHQMPYYLDNEKVYNVEGICGTHYGLPAENVYFI